MRTPYFDSQVYPSLGVFRDHILLRPPPPSYRSLSHSPHCLEGKKIVKMALPWGWSRGLVAAASPAFGGALSRSCTPLPQAARLRAEQEGPK